MDEAGGVVGATPEGMDHHILLSVEMTIINASINVLVHVILGYLLLVICFRSTTRIAII